MFSKRHGGVDMMASGLLDFSDDVALCDGYNDTWGSTAVKFPLEYTVANMKALEACLLSTETGTRIIIH